MTGEYFESETATEKTLLWDYEKLVRLNIQYKWTVWR